MKKWIYMILAWMILMTLTACGQEKGQDYLNGKVLEIRETDILIECIDESTNQLTGTAISVSKKVVSAAGIPEIQPGDAIRVVYDFDKVDKVSDPVKISHVYAIYLLDENGNVIPNQ